MTINCMIVRLRVTKPRTRLLIKLSEKREVPFRYECSKDTIVWHH